MKLDAAAGKKDVILLELRLPIRNWNIPLQKILKRVLKELRLPIRNWNVFDGQNNLVMVEGT